MEELSPLVKKMIISSERPLKWGIVAKNNAVALALHVAISTVYFFAVVSLIIAFEVFGQDTGAVVAIIAIVGFLLAAGTYLFVGFRFLSSSTRGNLLSVAVLPILLGAVPLLVGFFQFDLLSGIWLGGHFDNGVAHSLAAMINAPSVFTMSSLYSFITNPDPYTNWEPPSLLIIASFIPSLLMYVGLRLKLSREAKAVITSESEKA